MLLQRLLWRWLVSRLQISLRWYGSKELGMQLWIFEAKINVGGKWHDGTSRRTCHE
jgi:hypothetical protein